MIEPVGNDEEVEVVKIAQVDMKAGQLMKLETVVKAQKTPERGGIRKR